jgi:hypothetical protein
MSSPAVSLNRYFDRPRLGNLLFGLLGLFAAVPLAFLIGVVNKAFPAQPEKAVMITGILFGVILAAPSSAYLLVKRRAANPAKLGLIVLITAGILLVSIYIYWVSFYVTFPGDFLIWSESDFVNDILKFRIGYPLYTAQVNNDSFTYVPGPQLLTYFLAWVFGHPTSIPVYRLIQVGYTALAALLAYLCCIELLKIAFPERRLSNPGLWSAFWLPALFLIATNSITNPFVHNLHDDSLAQLATVGAFFLLLRYISTKDRRILAMMAILPAIGFWIKQSLMLWAVFYCFYLVLFDRPFSFRRLIVFSFVSFGAIGLVLIVSYLIWGSPFFYWVFTVLGSHGVSPLRSFQHLLDVWVYYVIGLFGGLLIIRPKKQKSLLGPWIIWLLLILSETYTSGIAWMVNHIGPGSLIAGVWFMAGLTRIWPLISRFAEEKYRAQTWLRAGSSVAVISLLFSGLGLIRIPIRPLSPDAQRYVRQIEDQFQGLPAQDVLLDVGSWVYFKEGVVMKDRAPSIGERGYSETGDFSGILQRLREQKYKKILVRGLHSPDFWYDNYLWPKSSGIRQALQENYHEVGQIKGVEGDPNYLLGDISILMPNVP